MFFKSKKGEQNAWFHYFHGDPCQLRGDRFCGNMHHTGNGILFRRWCYYNDCQKVRRIKGVQMGIAFFFYSGVAAWLFVGCLVVWYSLTATTSDVRALRRKTKRPDPSKFNDSSDCCAPEGATVPDHICSCLKRWFRRRYALHLQFITNHGLNLKLDNMPLQALSKIGHEKAEKPNAKLSLPLGNSVGQIQSPITAIQLEILSRPEPIRVGNDPCKLPALSWRIEIMILPMAQLFIMQFMFTHIGHWIKHI